MDEARFVESATEEWRVVYSFALRLTRDAHSAEDLTQDVYVQALRPERIEAFEPRGGGVRAWLLRITYRAFLNRKQRERHEGTLFPPLDDAVESVTVESIDAAAARDFDWEGIDERIKQAVASLDSGSREVLLLWAVEQLHYREIAEVLGVPIGTVMSRLHRARSKVSASLLSDPGAVADLGLRAFGTRPVTHGRPEGAS